MYLYLDFAFQPILKNWTCTVHMVFTHFMHVLALKVSFHTEHRLSPFLSAVLLIDGKDTLIE